MRYDTPIKIYEIESEYNPDSGNHEENKVILFEGLCNLSDADDETVSLLMGNLKRKITNVIIKNFLNLHKFRDREIRVNIFDSIFLIQRYSYSRRETNLDLLEL